MSSTRSVWAELVARRRNALTVCLDARGKGTGRFGHPIGPGFQFRRRFEAGPRRTVDFAGELATTRVESADRSRATDARTLKSRADE
ncbi:hypothetical protein OB955_23265 [Halobacteria archaeon AArc-m2/3/4]|uniref:Uncharacterized protein n=1 Tax=Natronoglomus mannanivorans TaxID=2979990 RepID=A0AAP3E068_9EURY|nr:hypothetical protein [Halobacteria archaeon AArc-xg1-1]MCU4975610.1 hypothetical protein [Halobacteria archaeon AArc-m2/3/4]